MHHAKSQLVTVYVITRTILKQSTVDIHSNTRVFSKEWSLLDIIKCALQTISADSHALLRYSESWPEK